MTYIKFAKDYGYPPAAPFWLVWNDNGFPPKFRHPNLAAAEAEAARLASENPGKGFHVLGVLATVSTSTDVVGTRFDPMRTPPAPVGDDIPEAPAPVEVMPEPAFLSDEDPI
ncbi:hypothetical protein JMG10_13260 [Nostoc ellipsosporum NOK]|nr:hypothetical protein [Nostoc ellipsosporum NOK]